MSDRVFLDSNVLVYSYSNSEEEKQAIAQKIISDNTTFISTQVLQELANTITRKFEFSYADAQSTVKECCENSNLNINSVHTILKACELAQKYNFSFYDCLIIAAAIESGFPILYSEDMNDGQVIDGIVTIINPFTK